MLARIEAGQAIVCCETCPGKPVLPTHNPDVNTRLCVRCQGENRYLSRPHPDDHLCNVCRRECPICQALTPEGGSCRRCRGKCLTCGRSLPKQPDPGPMLEETQHAEPENRWVNRYFARTWGQDRCPACLAAATTGTPVQVVLAAIPEKVLLACQGGRLPAAVIETVEAELRRHPVERLVTRIERRWFTIWTHRPLKQDADAHDEGYGPDEVAVWLIAPAPCSGHCEDGWLPATHPDEDDKPCPVCRGGRLLRRPRTTPQANDDDATDDAPAAASRQPTFRECTGKDGACGLPVAEPHPQCPACLNWPTCPTCSRRRYDPTRHTCCHACRDIPTDLDSPATG